MREADDGLEACRREAYRQMGIAILAQAADDARLRGLGAGSPSLLVEDLWGFLESPWLEEICDATGVVCDAYRKRLRGLLEKSGVPRPCEAKEREDISMSVRDFVAEMGEDWFEGRTLQTAMHRLRSFLWLRRELLPSGTECRVLIADALGSGWVLESSERALSRGRFRRIDKEEKERDEGT